jgi:acyl-coenzyme A thioesterase PaaI-like protein
LDIKFISASKEGDTLIGKVKISKKTNSLVFVIAELFNKIDLVATASGTWKII